MYIFYPYSLHALRKSKLYGGKQRTIAMLYTRCDLIADYRIAWAHFEKILIY